MRIIFFTFIFYIITFCSCRSGSQTEKDPHKYELATIDSLLRDSAFTQSMARALDSSYYAGIGQTPLEFLTANDDTAIVIKRKQDEKVATNLAGFYALECGVGLLCAQTNTTPVEWLQKITNGSADTSSVMLLNRFANATWKAGQPFRGLNRITRPNFIVFSSLSPDEVDKDYVQIKNAAVKLFSSLKTVTDSSMPKQMEALRSLLQDTSYAVEMASFLDSSFYVSQQQAPTPFSTPADDTATIKKSIKEMKIATSVAGFYALECGVNYLVATTNRLPSVILRSVGNNTMSPEEKMIFARFANATWKAGQPFRDLSRITRSTFTPFYFLTEPDIEKDMVQIRTAALRLLSFR